MHQEMQAIIASEYSSQEQSEPYQAHQPNMDVVVEESETEYPSIKMAREKSDKSAQGKKKAQNEKEFE